ncbi:MAG: right-handed parallel beta-helix repeat-containing protein, partial [Bacteroidota bacterium]
MNLLRLIPGCLAFAFGCMFPVSATTYYVSPTGDDTQAGTETAPFKTIDHAAEVMQSGDSCIIFSGVYREQVRAEVDDIVFMAADGNEVIVSGFDVLNGWTQDNGNIYVADMDFSLGPRNQLVYNQQMMVLARWPNKATLDPFELNTAKGFGTKSSVTNADIPDIAWEDGGIIFFLGKNRWTSWRTNINGSPAGAVTFNQISDNWQWAGAHSPENGGDFYLMNHIEALDQEGEWFLDRDNDKMYFYKPGGGKPGDNTVEVKRRTTGFNLANRKNVVVDGIKVVGANVNISGSQNCTIRNCEIIYGNHTIGTGAAAFISEASVLMNDNSKDNLVTLNNIQWGAANGVILKGTGNQITNNYIGNFNYLSSYGAPVELRGTNDLTYNEIFNGGRDLVRGGGNGAVCAYNDMHHSNLTNDDCGPFYSCCGNFNNTTIHHNWVHDCESPDGNFTKYKATGIYLDNSTEDVIVHHNVMWNLEWTGIQINWAGKNLLMYNNTIWSNDGPESKSMGRWVNGFEFTNVQLYNTLANEGEFHASEMGNNVVVGLNDDPFEDFDNQNFIPKAGTGAIDAGTALPPYTDNAVGSPDVGAYERGDTPWIPGPDWVLTSPPVSIDPPVLPLPKLG